MGRDCDCDSSGGVLHGVSDGGVLFQTRGIVARISDKIKVGKLWANFFEKNKKTGKKRLTKRKSVGIIGYAVSASNSMRIEA